MKTYKYFLNDSLNAVKTERNENPEFKRIFPIFLTWLLRTFKFPIPMVDFTPIPQFF